MSYYENELRSYNIQTLQKFPTITVEISFLQIQNEKDIEARNLVAKVLPQVLADFPTKIATKSYFSDLYAAKVYSGVKRSGDKHEVTFQFIFTDPKIIADENYDIDDLIACIRRVLLTPALENGCFTEKIVTVENTMMQARIANMYDDKSTYAQLQLLEQMFKGTPFAIRPYGKIENYQTLTNNEIYQAYQKMLNEDTMTIAVVGDVDASLLTTKLNAIFADIQQHSKPLITTAVAFEKRDEVQYFTETQALNQTKLHLGYRIPVTIHSVDYFKHRLAIEVLGGGAQSKLFQHVREQASLAYYVSAVMDAYAGAMYIYAGIDHEKITAAHEIILAQIEQMCIGNISAQELSMAKMNTLHRLSMMQDSALGLISLQRQLAEFKTVHTLAEWKTAIEAITVEDIMCAAKTWKEDTVFILTNNTEEVDV